MKNWQQTRLIPIFILFYALVSCSSAAAQTSTTPEREQRMEWWREARFGMFVHWGLYSGLAGTWEEKPVAKKGGMEWLQFRVRADTDTYADAALPLFKPKPGFAESWAKLAKQAGCQYLVFTTKHHDGFALHDSATTEFDAGSVLNRDLVREIVDACRAEGLRVGFYHSVIDWHHDQYCYLSSGSLPHPGKPKPYPNGPRDHEKYIDYLHEQVDELISNYGQVDVIWWDYSKEDFQGDEAWRASDLIVKVRSKQPEVIMNNRLFRTPEAGWKVKGMKEYLPQIDSKYGDFITPEQHVPEKGLPGIDWETCMTMNTTWGYSRHDSNWKSSQELIHTLIDIASKGGNYLLNIGPLGDGSVPEESVERLEAMGRWMDVNGEAIYGSTASPIKAPEWGRVTQNTKANTIYLHVFDWPNYGKLTVEGVPGSVTKATLLSGDVDIPVLKFETAVVLELPASAPDTIASVVRLQIEGEGK